MKEVVKELLTNQKNTSVDIYKLEKQVKERLQDDVIGLFYKEFADSVIELENEKVIERMKTGKPYSRDIRINTKYRKVKEIINNENELKNELLTSFHFKMKMSGYGKNLEQYKKDKPILDLISQFLFQKSEKDCYISVNERSFELFDDEKYLSSEQGRKLISNIEVTFEDLCCFETFEPFFHFGLATHHNQNVMIIENKDTFFSLKKLNLEGIHRWDGIPFEMLVYGEGNKITKSFEYLDELKVPFETSLYYFGDFDPEGIAIFHRLQKMSKRKIELWKPFYIEMWNRRKGTVIKEDKKQRWSETAIQTFLSHFDEQMKTAMENYLIERRYIPQEALNIEVLRSLSDGIKKTV
ncbi:DUF2220 domain-containing protein [Bacillus sp. FJAT-29790]|uniref:Wadjet anti-phage system protein JetD domain-containing protein n=1 Tax=Bacillus sp. FJAT-29790 TaxID=1895002 RepID=UPI001C23EAE5|nr:Wadjet anti-phage system protein JetD domain-containing protein [Bacillus sp. FJAT-29790]MBU8878186.1 DUF2220 domain-containing protein [Bacillus sp. FJAT-29790]